MHDSVINWIWASLYILGGIELAFVIAFTHLASNLNQRIKRIEDWLRLEK